MERTLVIAAMIMAWTSGAICGAVYVAKVVGDEAVAVGAGHIEIGNDGEKKWIWTPASKEVEVRQ